MAQVPASVRVVSSPEVEREQRSAVRHECSIEAVSCALDAPETLCWGATVQDLSAGGIGLSLCYPFKPGTYLAINVQGAESRTLLGRVIHVSDQADGTWFVGCEFVKQLDDVVELVSGK
jgi:hypothetical protein